MKNKLCVILSIELIVSICFFGLFIKSSQATPSQSGVTIVCGDIYPDKSLEENNYGYIGGDSNCGDGKVDIFDVIESIDIALDIGVHSDCQLTRADLPTGKPPQCLDPDGIVDVFDILVIIDVVLLRKNCCYNNGTTECKTNEDCDDGVYCNGAEVCVSGTCKSGADPCPDTVCDEKTNTCEEPNCDLPCDDGVYCNGVETFNKVSNCCDFGNAPCQEPLVW